ncbi:hypothetical protein Tco_0089304 [Tanacetum coccineum]
MDAPTIGGDMDIEPLFSASDGEYDPDLHALDDDDIAIEVAIPEPSVHEVGGSSTAADVRPPSTVKKLDTRMDDVEIRQDVLVTHVDTVREAVTAIGAAVGEIGPRVIALEGHTQETLIHMLNRSVLYHVFVVHVPVTVHVTVPVTVHGSLSKIIAMAVWFLVVSDEDKKKRTIGVAFVSLKEYGELAVIYEMMHYVSLIIVNGRDGADLSLERDGKVEFIIDVSGSLDRVSDFLDGETPWTYGGFAPGPPLGYSRNPSGSGGWLEADDLPIHAMRTTVASEPVIEVVAPLVEEVREPVEPIVAPVTEEINGPTEPMDAPTIGGDKDIEPLFSASDGKRLYDACRPGVGTRCPISGEDYTTSIGGYSGGSSTAADVRPPSTVEELDTRMDDVGFRHDVLVTRVDTVRDAVMAIKSVVGEIGPRVIALEGHTQETLIHMVQDRDAQIEQLSAEMITILEREYGLMQMIATMSKRLADVEKRIPGPPYGLEATICIMDYGFGHDVLDIVMDIGMDISMVNLGNTNGIVRNVRLIRIRNLSVRDAPVVVVKDGLPTKTFVDRWLGVEYKSDWMNLLEIERSPREGKAKMAIPKLKVGNGEDSFPRHEKVEMSVLTPRRDDATAREVAWDVGYKFALSEFELGVVILLGLRSKQAWLYRFGFMVSKCGYIALAS